MRRFLVLLILVPLVPGCGREPESIEKSAPTGTVVHAGVEDEAAEVLEFSGEVGEIDTGFRLAAGTELLLKSGSRLVLGFSDGSELVAKGPGRILLREMWETAATIDVGPGGIYKATSVEKIIGLHIAADTAAVLQGATVLLDANPDWPIAELLEGAEAMALIAGRKTQEMKIGEGVPLKPSR